MEIDYKTILESSIKGSIIAEKSGASGVIYIVDNGKNTYPRKVAYKSIRVDKLNDIKKEHFLIECDLWFKIPSSYLTKAFYPVIIDDLPFICMPYYELDLKGFMLSRSFNKTEALVIASQLSKALWEMQKTGVEYHQDFNPPNILVDDLSKESKKYPKNNCINYSIKITDFGIADLIKRIGPTLGGGGGKYPFKAPEQYKTKKYDDYNPDVFALGVMTYMLFTDLHPNGLSKEKALNKNTSSSNFKEWAFNAKITLDNKAIENIINKSLQENPSNRPNAEEFYNVLMNELSIIEIDTYESLKLKLDYFDNNDQFDPISKEIDVLINSAKFSHNIESVKGRVLKTAQQMFSSISSEKELIRICEHYNLLVFYSKNSENDAVLIKMSKQLINIFSIWYTKINVNHKYPQQEFKGVIFIKTPDHRDIEVVSDYLFTICKVLDKHLSNKDIGELFKQYKDDTFYSIYLYSRASSVRKSDIYKCIELLDKAKQLNKTEPLFDYMKYLWITHNSILNEDNKLEQIKDISYKELKKHHMNWKTIAKL